MSLFSPSPLLRIGLAVVFLYAAAAALLDPFSWVGFFPVFLRSLFPDHLLIVGHSISEAILACWLLSGWKIRDAATVAACALFSIFALNIGARDIVFRDLGLFFAALALLRLDKA